MAIVKKRIKLLIFFLIFIITAPIIVLYANGDILGLGTGWSFLKTGGIYVNGAPSGSEVYLNGKTKDSTSFFSRTVLFKNLRPTSYEIEVKKAGYNFWKKKITVTDNIVSDANVFMLPEKIELREITKYLVSATTTATSTKTNIKNIEYSEIIAGFTVKVVAKVSTSTKNLGIEKSPIMSGEIGIWKTDVNVFAKWFGKEESAPKYFCEVDCAKTIKIFSFAEAPRKIDFLPGYSAVLVSVGDKVVAVQIENNPDKTLQFIYKGIKPDYKIIDGSIYVRDGEYLAEVVL